MLTNDDIAFTVVKFEIANDGDVVDGIVNYEAATKDVKWCKLEFCDEFIKLFNKEWQRCGPSSIPAESIDLKIKSIMPCDCNNIFTSDSRETRALVLVFCILKCLNELRISEQIKSRLENENDGRL